MKWEYKELYKTYDMSGVIKLPYNSKVEVCDWIERLPIFMIEADTLFLDPPWNKGNMNTFYTKAEKEHVGISFLEFSRILLSKIQDINPSTLFLEMGKEWLSWYVEKAKTLYKYVTFYNSTYYHRTTNKCYVIHATNTYKTRRYKELEDLDEEDVIKWICQHHSYDCIGDLCMGQGLVGKYAYLNSKRFVGTELNPKRLAVLVDFITKHEQTRMETPGKNT